MKFMKFLTMLVLVTLSTWASAQTSSPPDQAAIDLEYNTLADKILQLQGGDRDDYSNPAIFPLISRQSKLWKKTSYYKVDLQLRELISKQTPGFSTAPNSTETDLLSRLNSPVQPTRRTAASTSTRSRSNPQVVDIYTTTTPVSGTQLWIYRRE